MKYRTPIIGGRFCNILYGILNNFIASKNNNEKYVFVNSKTYSNNILSNEIITHFNLNDLYIKNENNNIIDKDILFINENKKSPMFSGFNIDFSENDLNSFINEIILKSNAYKNISLLDDKLAIHIRGGDYLENSNYVFNFEKFLTQSMEIFQNKQITEIDIYTDDIEYAKKFINIISKFNKKINFYKNSEINDFVNLSLYKYKILWNSTFSYWSAYVNNVLFNDNFKNICVPNFHVKWINNGYAWQLNPKWHIIKVI